MGFTREVRGRVRRPAADGSPLGSLRLTQGISSAGRGGRCGIPDRMVRVGALAFAITGRPIAALAMVGVYASTP